MFHKVATARAVGPRTLLVHFKGGEARLYHMDDAFERWPQFRALMDRALFDTVKVDPGGYGVSWNDELDLSADELFDQGVELYDLIGQETRVVAEFCSARKSQGISQRALEDATGVRQPVIARMENGNAVPRLDTLLKLLAPLGKTLKVVDLEFDASEGDVSRI